jgi:hypothetical protein
MKGVLRELLEELRRLGLHRQEKGQSPRMGQTIKGVLGVHGWFAA